jgi:hypothetical protein
MIHSLLLSKKFNLSHLHVYNRISHTNHRCSLLIGFVGLPANCSNISISLLETLAALLSATTISAAKALALLEHVLQESSLVFFTTVTYFAQLNLSHL